MTKSRGSCYSGYGTAEVQAHTTLLHPHGRVCTFKKYSGVHSCVFLRSRRPFRPIQDRLICCAPQWSKFPFKITASSYLEVFIKKRVLDSISYDLATRKIRIFWITLYYYSPKFLELWNGNLVWRKIFMC